MKLGKAGHITRAVARHTLNHTLHTLRHTLHPSPRERHVGVTNAPRKRRGGCQERPLGSACLVPVVRITAFTHACLPCPPAEIYNPVPGVVEGVPSSRGYRGGFSSQLMVKDLRWAPRTAAWALC